MRSGRKIFMKPEIHRKSALLRVLRDCREELSSFSYENVGFRAYAHEQRDPGATSQRLFRISSEIKFFCLTKKDKRTLRRCSLKIAHESRRSRVYAFKPTSRECLRGQFYLNLFHWRFVSHLNTVIRSQCQ